MTIGPRMTSCRLGNGENDPIIGIDEANEMKWDPMNPMLFRCLGCGQRVRAHRMGRKGYPAAHFEHLTANPRCPVWQPGGQV